MLYIASMLAKYAHDSSTNLKEAAVFSSISTILNGAITATSIVDTLKTAQVARNEIRLLIESKTSTEHKQAA